MASTSPVAPDVAAPHREALDPAAIALQLERALRGLVMCADPDEARHAHTAAVEHERRRRLTAFVAGLPRTKQLRLAGAASLLDGQFDPEG